MSLVWPCVENDILVHYLEEVTEQVDLKLSKSKPYSVIHVYHKAYRAKKNHSPSTKK